MILASTLPATERRELPRLLPHSARSPFCLCTRIMLAFFHYCGRHLADQQSRMKLCSLLCKAQPPYLMTSGGMLSGPAALLFLSVRMALSTSSKDGGSSSLGLSAVSVDHPERLGRWCGPCLAGFVGVQPIFRGSIPYSVLRRHQCF